jgi:hypothetical protein
MSDTTTPSIGDRVRGAIAALRNSVGDAVPVEEDGDGNLRASSPTGRLVVAPGQSIASAWGNSAWDQTVNQFASAADRANQWPSPNPGSLSFRTDANVLEIYLGTAWRTLMGTPYVARAYRVAALTVSSGAAPVPLDTVDAGDDPMGMFSGGGFLVARAGRYQVNGGVVISTTTASDRASATLRKNGTEVTRGNQNNYQGGTVIISGVADIVTCAAGDTITLASTGTLGANRNLNVGSPGFNFLSIGALCLS